jgi:hypothetical protein
VNKQEVIHVILEVPLPVFVGGGKVVRLPAVHVELVPWNEFRSVDGTAAISEAAKERHDLSHAVHTAHVLRFDLHH